MLEDKQTVNVPVWAGVGAIVIAGALLVIGNRKRYKLLPNLNHRT